MADILRSYDWTFTSKHTQKARSRSYPWPEWFDGRIRRLWPKTDFDGPATSVERVIRTSANRGTGTDQDKIKVRVRIEVVDGVETIVLQAHDDADTKRGVTRSPSKATVDARRNGDAPAKATKAAPKRPSAKLVKPPAKGRRVSKKVSA